jgi:8-amino-7-oxononanoate synthase
VTLQAWLERRAQERAAAGLTRALRPMPAPGGRLVDLAGNDYLGLRRDPRVTAAAAKAAQEWGAGAGASRLVTGSLELHAQLETAVAGFTGHQAALAFSTGYHANVGVVTALSDPDTLIVSDAHVHASLIDGCRLARASRVHVTAHNDVTAVASALAIRSEPRALVLVESVYSVLGDAAPLVELAEVAARLEAVLVVDEAHALGVAGAGGRGLLHATGLSGSPDLVATVTLSKALGSQGGVVCGSPAVVEHLLNTARPFIYDTGLAPPAAGAALEALRIVEAEPGLPARSRGLAARFAAAAGVGAPAGCVLSVPMRSPAEAVQAQAAWAGEGFLVGCFRPPSVPDGVSRLRLTASAALSDEEAARVVHRLHGDAGARAAAR